METNINTNEETLLTTSRSSNKNFRFSFSSFQKAISENSDLRKQVKDIVDLGLFDYALRRNTAFIQAVREKAEAESMDLMMRFTNGVDDYQAMKRKIHKNRIIRTLAVMDRKAQMEFMRKFERLSAVAK